MDWYRPTEIQKCIHESSIGPISKVKNENVKKCVKLTNWGGPQNTAEIASKNDKHFRGCETRPLETKVGSDPLHAVLLWSRSASTGVRMEFFTVEVTCDTAGDRRTGGLAYIFAYTLVLLASSTVPVLVLVPRTPTSTT